MKEELHDVFREYREKYGLSLRHLERETGIPEKTLKNWDTGRVKKPRKLLDLIKLAKAMRLYKKDASRLLESASYPSISILLATKYGQGDDGTTNVLSYWVEEIQDRSNKQPFQAIADLPYFVGREEELKELKELLLAKRHVALYSLLGMGGVGKTALAVHLAYQLRPHFPDGILWARLDTTDTMSILAAFAKEYQCDVSNYSDIESRGQIVRSLLSDKRVLIILDNAQNSDEIKPLLPPTGTCAMLITTRFQNLSITGGAYNFVLKPFSEDGRESLSLFSKLLGETKTKKNHADLMEIADILGHLPQAIAIVASRLAYEPNWKIVDFLRLIKKERGRLDGLEYDDKNVRASFNLSYERLAFHEALFFASLGVFGGEDFSVEAVAYVFSIPEDETIKHFRSLYKFSLIQESKLGRYRLHPLLRDYAREQLENQIYNLQELDQRIEHQKFYYRMVSYYVEFISQHLTDYKQISKEYSNLLSALEAACSLKLYNQLIENTINLYRYWESQGMYEDANKWLSIAYDATVSQKDEVSEVRVLIHQARTYHHRGDYSKAISFLETAQSKVSLNNNPEAAYDIWKDLGINFTFSRKLDRAEEYFERCLTYGLQVNDNKYLPAAYNLISSFYLHRGKEKDLKTAERYLTSALETTSVLDVTINIRGNFAALNDRKKNPKEAKKHLLEALDLSRKSQNMAVEINILANLAATEINLKEYDPARKHLDKALTLCEKVNNRQSESRILRNFGELHCQAGDYVNAVEYYKRALQVAKSISNHPLILTSLNDGGKCILQFAEFDLKSGNLKMATKKIDQAKIFFEEAEMIASKFRFKKDLERASSGLKRSKDLLINGVK